MSRIRSIVKQSGSSSSSRRPLPLLDGSYASRYLPGPGGTHVTQTEQPVTIKAVTAAVARRMLEGRIGLVTTLGDAIDNRRQAGDAVTAAKTAQDTAVERHSRTALIPITK